MDLMCGSCAKDRVELRPAVAIVDGWTMCDVHLAQRFDPTFVTEAHFDGPDPSDYETRAPDKSKRRRGRRAPKSTMEA